MVQGRAGRHRSKRQRQRPSPAQAQRACSSAGMPGGGRRGGRGERRDVWAGSACGQGQLVSAPRGRCCPRGRARCLPSSPCPAPAAHPEVQRCFGSAAGGRGWGRRLRDGTQSNAPPSLRGGTGMEGSRGRWHLQLAGSSRQWVQPGWPARCTSGVCEGAWKGGQEVRSGRGRPAAAPQEQTQLSLSSVGRGAAPRFEPPGGQPTAPVGASAILRCARVVLAPK